MTQLRALFDDCGVSGKTVEVWMTLESFLNGILINLGSLTVNFVFLIKILCCILNHECVKSRKKNSLAKPDNP